MSAKKKQIDPVKAASTKTVKVMAIKPFGKKKAGKRWQTSEGNAHVLEIKGLVEIVS